MSGEGRLAAQALQLPLQTQQSLLEGVLGLEGWFTFWAEAIQSQRFLSRCCHLQHHCRHTFMTVHDGGRWRPLCKVPLGIRDTPIFKRGHPAEYELRLCGSKGPWLSSGTPCPTDTAPLGRIRQAQDLGLLFFSLVCWQVCPVLQPWLPWLSTKACQPPSRAWASLEAVHSWYMGRRWGQPRRRDLERNCGPHILFCTPFPAHGDDTQA